MARTGGGIVNHSQLAGVTSGQHHTEDHWSRHAPGGADVGASSLIAAYVTAVTTVNNSTTLVNGAGLLITLPTAGNWVLRGCLNLTSGIVPRLAIAFALGGGIATSSGQYMARCFASSGSNPPSGAPPIARAAAFATAAAFNTSDAIGQCLFEMGLVVTVPGTIQFRFAQATADLTDTTLAVDSFMYAVRQS